MLRSRLLILSINYFRVLFLVIGVMSVDSFCVGRTGQTRKEARQVRNVATKWARRQEGALSRVTTRLQNRLVAKEMQKQAKEDKVVLRNTSPKISRMVFALIPILLIGLCCPVQTVEAAVSVDTCAAIYVNTSEAADMPDTYLEVLSEFKKCQAGCRQWCRELLLQVNLRENPCLLWCSEHCEEQRSLQAIHLLQQGKRPEDELQVLDDMQKAREELRNLPNLYHLMMNEMH